MQRRFKALNVTLLLYFLILLAPVNQVDSTLVKAHQSPHTAESTDVQSCRSFEQKTSHTPHSLNQLAPNPHLWKSPPLLHREKLTSPSDSYPLTVNPGDWIVTGEEVREYETIVLTGNLIVEESGNLTLIDCALFLNCSSDGEYGIYVNGTFNILSGSKITAYNSLYRYRFVVYGALRVEDSSISYCYDGLQLRNTHNVLFQNATIHSNLGDGIYCYNSSYIALINCTLRNNYYWGIDCSNSTLVSLVNCTLHSNQWDGMFCYNSSNISLTNCTLTTNYCWGIYCYNSFNITLTNCTISSNYWDGAFYYSTASISLVNCTLTDNYYCGVYFYSSSDILLANCTLRGNYWDGAVCYDSSNISVANCTFSNYVLGLYYCYSVHTTVRSCVFRRDGIVLWGNLSAHYTSHIIEDNVVNGKPLYYIVNTTDYVVPSDSGQIIVANSTNIRIVNSNASCTDAGIQVAFSSHVYIHSVIAIDNDWDGIACEHSFNITLVNCTLCNNYWDGALGYNSTDISLINCTLDDNYRFGIYCYNLTDAALLNCTLRINSYYGMYCYYSNNTALTNCTIYGNVDYGICCWSSTGTEVHFCDIFSNGKHGLYNSGPTVNATYCWWGSPKGPEYKAEGDPDNPEEVYGDVLYKPWLPIDNTPPSVTITYPSNGAVLYAATVKITWTGSDNIGIDHYEVRLYNDTWDSGWIDVGTATSYSFSGLSNSTYTANVTAYDYAENANWDAVTFTVLIIIGQPPSVQITYPVNNTYLPNRHINATWEGSDDLGIDHYEVRLYNDTWSSGWINTGLQTWYEFTNLSETEYWLEVNATDINGLWNLTKHRFGIDLTPPKIRITTSTNDGYLNTATIEAAWTSSDNYGIDHYEVRLCNTTWDSEWISVGTRTRYTFTGLTDGGTYTLLVVAYDVAGNQGKATLIFTVDIAPPTIQIVNPVDGATLNQTTITVEWTGSDAGSGIDYYLIYLNDTFITSTTQTTHTLTDLSPGTYALTIIAIDQAGNRAQATVTFIVISPTALVAPATPSPSAAPISWSLLLAAALIAVAAAATGFLLWRKRREQGGGEAAL